MGASRRRRGRPAARNASLRSVVRTTGAVVLAISNLLGCPSGSLNERYDGRSPGSRVFAFGHLPGFPVVSRPSACRLQLRGQPRIGGNEPFTAFPFEPREGHRRPLDTSRDEAPSTEFGLSLPRLAGRRLTDHSG